MNQTDLPDPVREDITVLQRENSELTNRVLEMEDELKQLRRLVVMSEEAKTDNTVKTGRINHEYSNLQHFKQEKRRI